MLPYLVLRPLVAGVALMSLIGVTSAAIVTSVPPAVPPAASAAKAFVEMRPMPALPGRTIVLSPPSDAERAAVKSKNAASRIEGKARALTIGIGRTPSLVERDVRGASLAWSALPDGGRVARVDVSSPGAAAVRLGIVMRTTHPDVTVRFAGSAPGAAIFGPIPANGVAEAAARDGMYWSPVLEGSTGSVELYVPEGVSADAVDFSVVRVSHLLVAGADLRRLDAKDVRDIGASAFCEIDVACVNGTMPAVASTEKSVAKLVFTMESGTSAACTGTLINDSVQSFTPYLYTASHCIESQYAATTLNTYWFFEALTCGSLAVPPYVLQSGGAMLLGRSEDYDWSIVRLRATPPSGVVYAAWRAEPLVAQTVAQTIHHPQGDLKKWSQGTTTGYRMLSDGSTFIQMLWQQGSTEEGSSGAGLFTPAPGGVYLELRGGLFGGDASCSNRAGHDQFSRLDIALPLMTQYLTPNAPPASGAVAVVEFYNRALDHYFISANPGEINDLDSGVHPGWERTGLRFLAYPNAAVAPPDATPVCRFYLRPEVGDSHFYSGDPQECVQTLQRFGASWIYESPAVFFIQLPDRTTGACPAATHPVYRFFNTLRTNHRYTAEIDVRDRLRTTPGYVAEGYGPDAVIMCAPNQ